jgi:hypothetical protein
MAKSIRCGGALSSDRIEDSVGACNGERGTVDMGRSGVICSIECLWRFRLVVERFCG